MESSEVDSCIGVILNFNFTLGKNNIPCLTNSYRTLRDYCAKGQSNQTLIANKVEVIAKTKEIVTNWIHTDDKYEEWCVLLAYQFLANFLVGNVHNQRLVWTNFSGILFKTLCSCQPKIQNCTAMILYNIFLGNTHYCKESYKYIQDILELTKNEVTAEYSTFIIELLIVKSDFIQQRYNNLDVKYRLIILNIVELIPKDLNTRQLRGLFLIFSNTLTNRFESVFKEIHSELDELNTIEVVTLLKLLNDASCNELLLEEVQSVSQLLSAGVEALKSVHKLSKERGNHFSMLLKLSDMELMEKSNDLEVNAHPAFGFKGSLVRLIGNMCWHNKRNQDLARNLGTIPLILDCCNIDARNPFIIQWAVLALRNLCENNLENQKVVASVDRNGEVDSARFAQLGLVLKTTDRHT